MDPRVRRELDRNQSRFDHTAAAGTTTHLFVSRPTRRRALGDRRSLTVNRRVTGDLVSSRRTHLSPVTHATSPPSYRSASRRTAGRPLVPVCQLVSWLTGERSGVDSIAITSQTNGVTRSVAARGNECISRPYTSWRGV